jgi:hypothetical protein
MLVAVHMSHVNLIPSDIFFQSLNYTITFLGRYARISPTLREDARRLTTIKEQLISNPRQG